MISEKILCAKKNGMQALLLITLCLLIALGVIIGGAFMLGAGM